MTSVGANRLLHDVTLEGVITLGRELGRGAYGRVFTVEYRGLVCAAKEIHSLLLDGADPEEKQAMQENFIKECYHCSVINHPHIVKFMGVYYESNAWQPTSKQLPVMVMELMETSLSSFIQHNQSRIPMNNKISILHDVSLGLCYLHSRKPSIIHRDLSSNNVMLTSQFVAKIGDLGVAKVLYSDNRHSRTKLTTAPGTQDFMPPEALEINPTYGTPVDVFSFGGVALHVFSEEWPTPSGQKRLDPVTKNIIALTEVDRRKRYLDKMTGEALKKMVVKCLDDDPDERPPIKVIKEIIEPLMNIQQIIHQSQETAVVVNHQKTTSEIIGPLNCKQYLINWRRCASLPFSAYAASVAVDSSSNVYITIGSSPSYTEAYNIVYCYTVATDKWSQLPPPGHRVGILCMAKGLLTIIGGNDPTTGEVFNKVTTYNKAANSWFTYYPDMIYCRFKPGVTTYRNYVVVMGGSRSLANDHDSIEVMDCELLQWNKVSTHLPIPMRTIHPTISGKDLIIVGYTHTSGRSKESFKIPIATILSDTQHSSKLGTAQWNEFTPAPYWETSVVPFSNPPIIIGGHNVKKVPTADVAVYDSTKKTWRSVDGMTSAKKHVGIANINKNSIIVIGGSDCSVASSKATSVEIGCIVGY